MRETRLAKPNAISQKSSENTQYIEDTGLVVVTLYNMFTEEHVCDRRTDCSI